MGIKKHIAAQMIKFFGETAKTNRKKNVGDYEVEVLRKERRRRNSAFIFHRIKHGNYLVMVFTSSLSLSFPSSIYTLLYSFTSPPTPRDKATRGSLSLSFHSSILLYPSFHIHPHWNMSTRCQHHEAASWITKEPSTARWPNHWLSRESSTEI